MMILVDIVGIIYVYSSQGEQLTNRALCYYNKQYPSTVCPSENIRSINLHIIIHCFN